MSKVKVNLYERVNENTTKKEKSLATALTTIILKYKDDYGYSTKEIKNTLKKIIKRMI